MPVAVSNTAYGIIEDAMRDAGKLAKGDQPDSEDLADGLRRLCDLINLWQTRGLKLFLWREFTVPLVAGVNSYSLNDPDPQVIPNKNSRVIQGRVQTPNGETRPMMAISWDEWNRLPQSSEGTVTSYFTDKQATTLTLRVWNTPDAFEATNSMVLLVQVQAANPFNLLADVAFPQEWRIALRWGLSAELTTGQPQAVIDRCDKNANIYREALEAWDVEDGPTFFAPDFRGAYPTGNFR